MTSPSKPRARKMKYSDEIECSGGCGRSNNMYAERVICERLGMPRPSWRCAECYQKEHALLTRSTDRRE